VDNATAVQRRVRRPRADALRNRERIISAAREMFVEYGPDVPLDEIARRTGAAMPRSTGTSPTEPSWSSTSSSSSWTARLMVALSQLTRPLPGIACRDIDGFVHRHLQLFLDGLQTPARSVLPGHAATLEDLRRTS
jgi:hypothetical protein